jgi:hypothetical protein
MTDSRRNAVAILILVTGVALITVPVGARLLSLTIASRTAAVLGCLGIVALLVASTMRWSGDLCASAPRALRQRYLREFIPPMFAYAVVMMFWKPLLASVEIAWLRAVVAVLPAVLVLLALRSIMRYVRDSDEMQRRIELESIAIAAGFTSAAFLTAGFLQSAKLIAVQSTSAMLMVFPSICLAYGLAKIVIARRYL